MREDKATGTARYLEAFFRNIGWQMVGATTPGAGSPATGGGHPAASSSHIGPNGEGERVVSAS